MKKVRILSPKTKPENLEPLQMMPSLRGKSPSRSRIEIRKRSYERASSEFKRAKSPPSNKVAEKESKKVSKQVSKKNSSLLQIQ